MLETNEKQGYILLMSILVASIVLAISFGIYALSIKDLVLAAYLKDSAVAFGAADRGVECSLYWDRGYPQNGLPYTIFTTSTQYVSPLTGGISPFCDGAQLNTLPSWSSANNSADTGNTSFSLAFPDGTCADISVLKEGNSTTTIVSNGYNLCDPADPRRTQRTIQVQGNF